MPELAEPFDGPKGLLVVDLEEPCAAALVTLVHVGTVAERLSVVGTFARGRAERSRSILVGPAAPSPAGGSMETEITFLGGRVEMFPQTAEIKLTQFGVEVMERDGDDAVRVLFPWGQIEKLTQRGSAVAAVYTWGRANPSPPAASSRSSPKRKRGPAPFAAASSSGLNNRHVCSERQPHPMHVVRSSRSRSSSAIRSSRWRRHPRESLAHCALVGARSGGNVVSASAISLSERPTRWADEMNASRRSTCRGNARRPLGLRSARIKPSAS